MNRNITQFVLLCAAALWAGRNAPAQEKHEHAHGEHESKLTEPAEAVCPVSGEPIDEEAYTYFREKRVYFCCNTCKGKFEKDPESYADGVRKQWNVLRPLRVQVKCPGEGKPVDSKVFVEEPAGRVYFCGPSCKARWEKGEADIKKQLETCYTFQTNCVICDDDIDRRLVLEVSGRTVYLGCEGCRDAFRKNAEANLKKLDEQIEKNKSAWEARRAKRKPD